MFPYKFGMGNTWGISFFGVYRVSARATCGIDVLLDVFCINYFFFVKNK